MNIKYGLTGKLFKQDIILFFGLLIVMLPAYSQEIQVNVKQKQLNTVLTELRSKYNLQLSYNDTELSKYTITVSKNFNSANETIDFLLNDLPFSFLNNDGVFVIYYDSSKLTENNTAQPATKKFYLSGKILDGISLETLPFSFIAVNDYTIMANQNGQFSFVSQTDSIFRLKISHLGYHVLDTIVGSGFNFQMVLEPASIEMKAVNVKAPLFVYAIKASLQTAGIQINHQIAQFYPGNGDNSVFHLLRLQSGVLAAGEHKADLIVWASYPGQTRVSFDGFTLWGLKNFNENIGVVNPYLTKDIVVHKAGYQAEFGGNVGAMVDITGIDGQPKTLKTNININNNTINLHQNIPLFKKAALQIAHRRTFYNLYTDTTFAPKNNDNPNLVYAYPDYKFNDWNVKLTGNLNSKNSFKINYYTASDKFGFKLQQQRNYIDLTKIISQTGRQKGASILYNISGKKGNTTLLKVAYSALNEVIQDTTGMITSRRNIVLFQKNQKFTNNVHEYRTEMSNRYAIAEKNELRTGIEWNFTQSQLQIDSSQVITYARQVQAQIISAYVRDIIGLSNNAQLHIGFRNDYLPSSTRHYPQIRLSGNSKIGKKLHANVAWGTYYQYLNLVTFLDNHANVQRLWHIVDGQINNPTYSKHAVAQLSFEENGWCFHVEGFHKNTTNLFRILHFNNQTRVSKGYNNTAGFGVLLKKQWQNHHFWANYTHNNSQEYFSYFKQNETRPAFHNQKHEIKFAGMLALKPIYVSANYVWGSGFPNPAPNIALNYVQQPYSRLDISVVYRKRLTNFKLQTGLSILNVLNSSNVRFDDIYSINNNDTNYLQIYTQAVSFTPSLFLNIEF